MIIELLHCLDKSQVSFLDQIQEQHPPAHIALGNADHQTKIGLRQPLLGPLVAIRHPLGKFYFLIGGKKRHLADLLKVHPHRIFNADAVRHRQVDLLHVHFIFIGDHDIRVVNVIVVIRTDPEHVHIVGLQIIVHLLHLL